VRLDLTVSLVCSINMVSKQAFAVSVLIVVEVVDEEWKKKWTAEAEHE